MAPPPTIVISASRTSATPHPRSTGLSFDHKLSQVVQHRLQLVQRSAGRDVTIRAYQDDRPGAPAAGSMARGDDLEKLPVGVQLRAGCRAVRAPSDDDHDVTATAQDAEEPGGPVPGEHVDVGHSMPWPESAMTPAG